MKTGLNRMRAGIGDFTAALMGGGTAARAEQDETKRLAEAALLNAKRRNEALQGQMLQTQATAQGGLGDAVAQLVGNSGVAMNPGALTTFLQAGGGNAQQMSGGFTNIGDFMSRQAGARQFVDPATRVQGAANIAAGKGTPADVFETSGGVTTNRFTGATSTAAMPAQDPSQGPAKQVIPASAQTMKLFMRPSMDEKGRPVTNPLTGEAQMQLDNAMLQHFLAWALQTGATDLNHAAQQYAAQVLGGGGTAMPSPGVTQAAPAIPGAPNPAGGRVIDFNDLQ